MSLASAARNLSRHLLVQTATRLRLTREDRQRVRFQLTGWQPGALSQAPALPAEAALTPFGGPDTPEVLCSPYDLLPQPVTGHSPAVRPPEGWQPRPRPDKPLELALPYPWDSTYQDAFGQLFQPVKAWRNAVALCNFIEHRPEGLGRTRALTLLEALLERIRDYTVWEDAPTDGTAPVAWLENRFDYTPDQLTLRAPWVSGLANAFAILACLRMRAHLDTVDLACAYGNAYLHPFVVGQTRPERWISARDRHGYLWFEEYPTPRGRMLHVKNGHIFAVLALHELSLVQPQAGYDPLVQAGATTIEAYAPCFRRPGLPSLYARNWYGKPDYLPNRAMRQLFQLYELTGAPGFLVQGDLFVQDACNKVSKDLMEIVHVARREAVAQRAAFDPQAPGR